MVRTPTEAQFGYLNVDHIYLVCSGRDWCVVSSAAGLPSSRSAEISGPRAHECRDDALRRADSAASERERPPPTAKPVLIAWICVSLALFHARNSVEHSSARWLCVRIRCGRAGPYYQLIAASDQLKTSSKQTVGRPINGQSAACRLLEYLIYDRTSIYGHY